MHQCCLFVRHETTEEEWLHVDRFFHKDWRKALSGDIEIMEWPEFRPSAHKCSECLQAQEKILQIKQNYSLIP